MVEHRKTIDYRAACDLIIRCDVSVCLDVLMSDRKQPGNGNVWGTKRAAAALTFGSRRKSVEEMECFPD